MKILRYNQSNFDDAVAIACGASSLFDENIDGLVREVIAKVKDGGDAALLKLTEEFDKVKLTVAQLHVADSMPTVSEDFKSAVDTAHKNIAAFAKEALREEWEMCNAQDARVGEKFDPFQRVGIYIPGGTAPLVSTALMTGTLAKVAGCPEIIMCTPARRDGTINPNLLYAILRAGATEVYRVGGAQAIAAMALGTATIKRVQKVFGPGNAYVVAAKRLLFGYVGVDLLPGPSEVLIIADESADPRFIAADMLAQAEHGSGHERVCLVTTSEKVLDETNQEIERQLADLRLQGQRFGYIQAIVEKSGLLVLVQNLDRAVVIANQFAPEHCEVMTKNPRTLVPQIKTAGAIFLGPWSPTVVGDYLAGPSHTLPTGGAGRSFAGLTVDQFQRRTSVIECSEAALRKSLPALEAFGKVEGLDAHVKSARIRFP